ncbi:MAG: amidohydrolase family protein [Clostridia bacterium]|nr:amidohydrolase family protein [Clostridia bacterium]
MQVFDFHTHTFPDKIAAAAVQRLQAASHTQPFSDGTVSGLKRSMEAAGISASLVLPVATNTRQVQHVNDASIALNDGAGETGIYSFGCMHPDYADHRAELRRLAAAGIRGIKLHPVYQGVDFDDIRYLRILEEAASLGLTVLIHAGLDVGFPGVVHASPGMILNALRSVGPVTLILAHMGGWRCWDEVLERLPGTGVFIDTSFSLGSMTANGDGYYRSSQELALLSEERFMRIIRAFGAERVLFGTDSPWGDQAAELRRFLALPLTEDEKRRILGANARKLLGI